MFFSFFLNFHFWYPTYQSKKIAIPSQLNKVAQGSATLFFYHWYHETSRTTLNQLVFTMQPDIIFFLREILLGCVRGHKDFSQPHFSRLCYLIFLCCYTIFQGFFRGKSSTPKTFTLVVARPPFRVVSTSGTRLTQPCPTKFQPTFLTGKSIL